MLENISNPGIIQSSNWDRLRDCFNVACHEIDQGHWQHKKKYDSGIKSNVYSLESHGVITSSVANDNSPWKFWGGRWIESLLPWTKGMRQEMQRAGFTVATISYHAHTFSVAAHKDSLYSIGVSPDVPHTNVNYIISSKSPDTSYTWVRDDEGNEMRYYSHPDKLWIVNAGNLHAIVTDTFREALIIKFNHPFDQIKSFFDSNPDFFNENQPYFKS